MMGYRYGYGYNMMQGGGFWFICLIVIIVVVYVIYKLTRSGRNEPRNYNNDDSLEIIKQRYAKGEIDEEQYKKIRDTLMNK